MRMGVTRVSGAVVRRLGAGWPGRSRPWWRRAASRTGRRRTRCATTSRMYTSLGGPAGPLGLPTSAQQPYGVDGLRQTFTGGAIVWTPATGAYLE